MQRDSASELGFGIPSRASISSFEAYICFWTRLFLFHSLWKVPPLAAFDAPIP